VALGGGPTVDEACCLGGESSKLWFFPEEEEEMSCKLGGTYFETCSCDVVCPWTASLAFGATYERCKVVLVFNVKDGEVDETEALAPLVGDNVGVRRESIEVREDGLRHSIRIADEVDFEIEDIVPLGVETGEPARLTEILHPAGSELNVAHATRSKINAFRIQYEGNAAFSTSRFSWAA
jgi:hypothetical protein